MREGARFGPPSLFHSRQEEQEERRQVVENDRRVRASTLSQFAQADTDINRGRFTAHERSTVIGSTPIPKYEGAPNWAHDPVPTENPLGYSINEMDTTGQPHELKASSLEPFSLPSPAQEPLGGPSLSPATKELANPSSQQVPPLTGEGLGFSQRVFRRF